MLLINEFLIKKRVEQINSIFHSRPVFMRKCFHLQFTIKKNLRIVSLTYLCALAVDSLLGSFSADNGGTAFAQYTQPVYPGM